MSCRVHGEAHSARVGRVGGRLDDRLLRGEIVALLVDEPHLDEIGLAFQFAPDQRTRRVGRGHLDDGRIAEIELHAIDHGNERAGDGDAGRRGTRERRVAHVEIPERPADIDDAGDAAREPDLERGGKAGLVALDFLRVRHPGIEVGHIGTRVEIARLEEVDVRIDQSGNDPFASAVDPRRPRGHRSRARRPDRLDAAPGDDHRAVRSDRGRKIPVGMNDRGADDRRNVRRLAWNNCQHPRCNT